MAIFEDPTKNVTIFNDDESKSVTITSDGSKERLDVNTPADNNPTQYTLEFIEDAAGVTVTSASDLILATVTGSGLIDFVRLSCNSAAYEVVIEIDSVERFRATMANIGNDWALSNATNVQLWADTANKNFGFNPSDGVGFSTDFSIKARATGSDVTIKTLVQYRELT